jgi:MFS family permease
MVNNQIKSWFGIIKCVLSMFFVSTGIGIFSLMLVLYGETLSNKVSQTGMILALIAVTEGIGCYIIGRIFHNENHARFWLVGSIFCGMGAQLFLALGPSERTMIPIIPLIGICYAGVSIAMNLCMIRNSPAQNVGTGIGIYTAAIAAGNSFGSFLSGRLSDIMSYKNVFLFSALFFLFGMIAANWITCPLAKVEANTEQSSGSDNEKKYKHNKNYWIIGIVTVVFFSIINQAYELLFPVYGLRNGLDGTVIGTISGLRMVLAASVRILSGLFLSVTPLLLTNKISFFALCLGTLLIPFVKLNSWEIYLIIVIIGLSYGITRPVCATIAITGETDTKLINKRISYFSFSQAFGQAAAPLLVGILADAISMKHTFILIPSISIFLFFLASLVIYRKSVS